MESEEKMEMEMGMKVAEEAEIAEERKSLIINFRKPYQFEGEMYTVLDLSGLEDATAKTLESVGRILTKKGQGGNPATLEMTMEYAQLLASRVTKFPVEFFENLPAKEAMKLKTTVVGFLYAEDGEN